MKIYSVYTQSFRLVLLLSVISFSGLIAAGQDKADKEKYKVREFCSENWSNDNKVGFSEIREMTVRPTSLLSVDAGKNGGIKVKGENRSDILVRACVRTWGETAEAAKSAASSIRISTDSVIQAEGMGDNWNASVSYEILVPRSTNLKLETFNGGISISGVDGNIDFKAMNGGVSLSDLAGNVKGKTTNGGVSVTLSGNSWKGSGLDIETSNGGVHLMMPETYAAHIETGTVNGGYRSDSAALEVEKKNDNDRYYGNRATRINTDLNGGGALIRVMTTNGGVKISSSAKSM